MGTKQNQTVVQNQQVSTSPTTITSRTPTPDETANWKTYRNDNLGFSIQYPVDYKIEEKIFSDKTGRITLSSPDLTWEEFGGGDEQNIVGVFQQILFTFQFTNQ